MKRLLKYLLLITSGLFFQQGAIAEEHFFLEKYPCVPAHITEMSVKKAANYDVSFFLGERKNGICQKIILLRSFNQFLTEAEWRFVLYRIDLEVGQRFDDHSCAIEEFLNKQTGKLTTVEYRLVKAQDKYAGMIGDPIRSKAEM